MMDYLRNVFYTLILIGHFDLTFLLFVIWLGKMRNQFGMEERKYVCAKLFFYTTSFREGIITVIL